MDQKTLTQILYTKEILNFFKPKNNYEGIDSVYVAEREIGKVKQKIKTLDNYNTSQTRAEKMKARLRVKLAEKEIEKQNKPIKRKW